MINVFFKAFSISKKYSFKCFNIRISINIEIVLSNKDLFRKEVVFIERDNLFEFFLNTNFAHVGGRLWNHSGELWGQPRTVVHEISTDLLTFVWHCFVRSKIDPGVIQDNFETLVELPESQTCHAKGEGIRAPCRRVPS